MSDKLVTWKSCKDCCHFSECRRFVIHPVGLNWGGPNARVQYDSVVMYDYADMTRPIEHKCQTLKAAKILAEAILAEGHSCETCGAYCSEPSVICDGCIEDIN